MREMGSRKVTSVREYKRILRAQEVCSLLIGMRLSPAFPGLPSISLSSTFLLSATLGCMHGLLQAEDLRRREADERERLAKQERDRLAREARAEREAKRRERDKAKERMVKLNEKAKEGERPSS